MKTLNKFPSRRACLAAVAGLGLALTGSPRAAPRTVAIISLIGDKLEVVVPQMTTGSYLDRNSREGLNDQSGAFDRFTVKAAADAIAAVDPGIGTALIGLPPSGLHDRPEQMFDGKHVALPDAVVDELERVRASHLVLLTKHRDDVRVPFWRGMSGIGKVRGLGFYVDTKMVVRLVNTGESGAGFLAPFAYFLVSLVDVRSGLLLRQQKVTMMETLSAVEFGRGFDPWATLDAAQKVERLEQLIRQGLAESMPPLLQGL